MAQQRRVDRTGLQVNQALVILLVVVAFLLGRGPGQWVVLGTASAMLLGALYPPLGPFRLLYRYLLQPLGVLRPRPVPDDPRPHRFALGLGGVFLFLSAALHLSLGDSTAGEVAGWAVAWLVLALAAVNLLLHF